MAETVQLVQIAPGVRVFGSVIGIICRSKKSQSMKDSERGRER